MNQPVYKIKKTGLDFICFLWLLAGIAIFGFIGLFLPRAEKKRISRAKEILKWTSNHVAPGSEKILDLEIAHELVEKYFKDGKTLDVAFGQGRFGEEALSPIIKQGGVIDGLDLETEPESNVETMRYRPWVSNAWKRSYLATGLSPKSYKFLFCNNGLMGAEKIEVAFDELWRIAEDDGVLIFNMVTNVARDYTYRLFIILNCLILRFDRAAYWKKRARSRVKCYYDPDALKDILARSGWSVVDTRYYLSGWYMRWHYLFNFPAFHRFFTYETAKNAPKYYDVMKNMWRGPFNKTVLMHLRNASKNSVSGRSAKCYIVVKKKPDPERQDRLAMTIRPIRAFIDVSYACNLNCIMCDVYSENAVDSYSNRSPAFMERKLFERIIDQTAEYVQSYYIQLRGEPLLHPNYIDLLKYCRIKAPKTNIFFNTNGLLLKRETVDDIMKIGVNGIYISIDAFSEETYNKIRIGSDFNRVMENIEYLLSVRHRSPVKLEVGVSFVIQDQNRDEQEVFLKYWQKRVDRVMFYTKAELDKARKHFFFKPQEKSKACSAVEQNLVVLVDGTVVPCCGDISGEVPYGNLGSQSLAEIFSSQNMREFQAKVIASDVDDIELCRNCFMWTANEIRSELKDNTPVDISPIHMVYNSSHLSPTMK